MVILPFAALQYFDFEGSYAMSFVVDGYAGFWAHEYYENATKRMCKGVPIMQYTGLKDKYGLDIYEGDIIKSRGGLTVYVKWNEEHAAFLYVNDTGFSAAFSGGDSVEIIGNIYQNKELLTV
jgi:hypothetical protein